MTTRCPRDKERSKISGRCIKKCKSGQVRNAANRCVSKKRKPTKNPVSRQVKRSRKIVSAINRMSGRRVARVSVKGKVRPSAGQAFRDGAPLGTRACYDGTCKYLRHDKNGRAYWGS